MFNYDLTVRGGENCWTSLPVIKMKFNLLNKTCSFLIVLKFRKTYIQIVKNCLKNKKDICKKTEIRILCRQFVRSGEIIMSVTNDDGDGNNNGKKSREWVSIGITTTLNVDHAICTFLCRHCTTTT